MNWVSIFFDDKGVFQWTSMTAAVALLLGIINIGISIWNNRKTLKIQQDMHKKNIKQQQSISQDNLNLQREINTSNFKGNVVSKSRIEWIQEVRKKSVDFISACYNLFEFIELHIKDSELDAEQQKEFSILKNEIKKNGVLLILYFGPDSNKNNDLIACIVTSLVDQLISGIIWSEDRKVLFYNKHKVDILKDFLRIYFKAEWKRANGEINESNLQEYLENDKLYLRIQKVCNDILEEHKEWYDGYYDFLEEEFRKKTP